MNRAALAWRNLITQITVTEARHIVIRRAS